MPSKVMQCIGKQLISLFVTFNFKSNPTSNKKGSIHFKAKIRQEHENADICVCV